MATFLLGDCLDLMKDIPDKSVDCFICDLPYGCLSGSNTNVTLMRMDKSGITGPRANTPSGSLSGCAWDVKIDLVEFWKQVKRLCKDKHTPVLMFCNTKFGADLINSNPSWFRYDLVWDKERGVSFLSANKMPMKSHEMVYVFSKAGAYYKRVDEDAPGKGRRHDGESQTLRNDNMFGTGLRRSNGADKDKACVKSVIRIKKVGTIKQGHPTQKPEDLYRWLLTRYCPVGGTVLDPTAGSFNACFVAKELGLKAIGMEKDRGFFYKAVARLLKLRSGDVIEHVT